jgi:hypothetical protein
MAETTSLHVRTFDILAHKPSLISLFAAVFPLIFHSIKDEIPEAGRPTITRLFQLWLVLFGTLIINFVACIFIMTAGANGGGSDLGSSIGCVTTMIAEDAEY